jgi:hypothetical protein
MLENANQAEMVIGVHVTDEDATNSTQCAIDVGTVLSQHLSERSLSTVH